MGKYHCAYCQSCLTHGSRSIRKNHLHGKHHQRLYYEYYEKIAQEYPECDERQNGDPSLNSQLMKDMFRDIPGSNNEVFKDSHYYNSRSYSNSSARQKFKLQVPDTSIALPNPPPNALHVNYSNVIYKNRASQPYKSGGYVGKSQSSGAAAGGGSGTGTPNGYGFPSGGYGYKGRTSRARETTPREKTPVGVGAVAVPVTATAAKSVASTTTPAATESTHNRLSPVLREPQQSSHGYGYGYGYGYGGESRQRGGYREGYGRGGYRGRGGSSGYRGRGRGGYSSGGNRGSGAYQQRYYQ